MPGIRSCATTIRRKIYGEPGSTAYSYSYASNPTKGRSKSKSKSGSGNDTDGSTLIAPASGVQTGSLRSPSREDGEFIPLGEADGNGNGNKANGSSGSLSKAWDVYHSHHV